MPAALGCRASGIKSGNSCMAVDTECQCDNKRLKTGRMKTSQLNMQ